MFSAHHKLDYESLDMGHTTKSQAELETFLRTISHLFTRETYDLLNNNCNNFSNAVCDFLTGHGIPEHIVELPKTIFSTPSGKSLRPIVEGMQDNIRQFGGPAGMDPFGKNAHKHGTGCRTFEAELSITGGVSMYIFIPKFDQRFVSNLNFSTSLRNHKIIKRRNLLMNPLS